MMTSQEVREIDGWIVRTRGVSAYTEALCPLHNIHTIVKNKNKKNEI